MAIEEYELATLKNRVTYVAGFSDPSIEARTDLYDLFISGQCRVCSKKYNDVVVDGVDENAYAFRCLL